MKKTLALIGIVTSLAMATISVQAQLVTVTATNLQQALQFAGLAANLQSSPAVQIGVPFTVAVPGGAQNVLITTNAAGLYVVSSFGVLGTNSITPPSNVNDFIAQGTAMVNENNPANIGYYGTNEIASRVGVLYLQNSGQAVFSIAVAKWGLFGYQNVGIGAGILEGNQAGKQGTAGYWGELDYRKPIGDVAVVGGIVGGYDEWNKSAFGGVKAGLEYRQNAHLGEYIEVSAVYENKKTDQPFLIGGGVTYAF